MTEERDGRSEAELRAAVAAGEAAQRELSLRARDASDIVDRRVRRLHAGDDGMRRGAAFTPEELTYAAYARCGCGAGMAYPKRGGIHGAWDCSTILLATAEAGSTHDAPAPFAFVEIKSEGQPSANGATTRPTSP